ncbi:MAG: hypothetical protein JXJ04_10540 [Spirochaetales bacterium]|nr:hypothetical protein [Spirochaetales bacterium]
MKYITIWQKVFKKVIGYKRIGDYSGNKEWADAAAFSPQNPLIIVHGPIDAHLIAQYYLNLISQFC